MAQPLEEVGSPSDSPGFRRLTLVAYASIPIGIGIAVMGWVLPISNQFLTRWTFGILTTALGLMVAASSVWGLSMLSRVRARTLSKAPPPSK